MVAKPDSEAQAIARWAADCYPLEGSTRAQYEAWRVRLEERISEYGDAAVEAYEAGRSQAAQDWVGDQAARRERDG